MLFLLNRYKKTRENSATPMDGDWISNSTAGDITFTIQRQIKAKIKTRKDT